VNSLTFARVPDPYASPLGGAGLLTYMGLDALLAKLEPGMQLFVPSAWAQRELRVVQRDTAMAALAYANSCDLLMKIPLNGEGEIGYLFSKRTR
jgi:hypothetical protein